MLPCSAAAESSASQCLTGMVALLESCTFILPRPQVQVHEAYQANGPHRYNGLAALLQHC